MRNLVRQGDLLFVPVEEIPVSALKRVANGVIALGEATGHHHRVAVEDMPHAEVYEIEDGATFQGAKKVLRVSEHGNISIVHEEHGTVVLEPGNYIVRQAREYDYASNLPRTVTD